MTFDKDTHKFGMAYKIDNAGENKHKIIYPRMSHGLIFWIYEDGSDDAASIDYPYLERAPEHDLIPASKVKALVEALELAPEPVANPSYEYLEDWNQWYIAAMKALAAFKEGR